MTHELHSIKKLSRAPIDAAKVVLKQNMISWLRAIHREPARLFKAFDQLRYFITSEMSRRQRHFHNPYDLEREVTDELQADLQLAKEQLLPNIVKKLTRAVNPDVVDREGDLYLGNPGIGYAFYHVSRVFPMDLQYQQLAQRYLQPAIARVERRVNHLKSGFLCGDAGVIAVGTVITEITGDKKQSEYLGRIYASLSKICEPLEFLPAGSDEFFVGRAGYLYGALWLNKTLGRQVVSGEIMHQLGRTIVASGKKYAAEKRSACPLMYAYYETEYLGAAHGLTSILQVLIQIPNFLSTHMEANNLVRRSVDYLVSLETPSGNYPCALDETGCNARCESEELVHWCHGAPGVVYLLAAAYIRWQEARYLQACLRAGDLVWRKGLLQKGPGICHGIAGSGYVFLLLYRLTKQPIHLRRAAKFARFLKSEEFERHARTPDTPYSLYEGLAGTLCFIADLERPDSAAFPFQDPFL